MNNTNNVNDTFASNQTQFDATGIAVDASAEEREAAMALQANQTDELNEQLQVLQKELLEVQAKNQDLQDQFLRGQAEVQNARRRADDEVSKARKFALESFSESLLPVLDSLEAGLAIVDVTLEQIKEGSSATLRQLQSALERNKVIAINPQAGAKFDPNFHQSIGVVPSEHEANSVVTVLQKGYSIAERTLRPALVMLSAEK